MFVQNRRRLKNYHETVDRQVENTLSFENVCDRYEYANPEMAQVDTTSRSLMIHDNVVLLRLIDIFISEAVPKVFTDEELLKYKYRPKWLSLDYYGATDYWWLILAVNGISSDLHFDNFSSLLMPDQQSVNKRIGDELYQRPLEFETSSV